MKRLFFWSNNEVKENKDNFPENIDNEIEVEKEKCENINVTRREISIQDLN